MSELNTTCGGWSTFSSEMTEQAQAAFETALSGLIGVDYNPVAFAEQVVAGMNYQFFCNAKAVYPMAPNAAAMIHIYQPLDEKAHITKIDPLN
ncbi:hypothetical protein [Photobacterium frigidiphilum]|nr:hypothetical protein [Photobacterium frigidiphilum]